MKNSIIQRKILTIYFKEHIRYYKINGQWDSLSHTFFLKKKIIVIYRVIQSGFRPTMFQHQSHYHCQLVNFPSSIFPESIAYHPPILACHHAGIFLKFGYSKCGFYVTNIFTIFTCLQNNEFHLGVR